MKRTSACASSLSAFSSFSRSAAWITVNYDKCGKFDDNDVNNNFDDDNGDHDDCDDPDKP